MNERFQFAKVAPGLTGLWRGWNIICMRAGWKNRCFIWLSCGLRKSTGARTAWICTGRT